MAAPDMAAHLIFSPAAAPCPPRFERHLLATMEDQQAVRAVAFHPSGNFVAVGSNSQVRVQATLALRAVGHRRLPAPRPIDSPSLTHPLPP